MSFLAALNHMLGPEDERRNMRRASWPTGQWVRLLCMDCGKGGKDRLVHFGLHLPGDASRAAGGAFDVYAKLWAPSADDFTADNWEAA